MSETPRTDEAKIWLDILPTFQMSYEKVLCFSRQLERELAEAKAELAKVREGFDMCQSDYKCLAERWGEALKERDLAQDELAKVREGTCSNGCNIGYEREQPFNFCPYCGKRIEEVKP